MAQAMEYRLSAYNSNAGIDRIMVQGYKSLHKECDLEIRPLTILAGANSAGKSSAMQPLLLLKQTFEAGFDPGPLLLDGEHVKLARALDMFCRTSTDRCVAHFTSAFEFGHWQVQNKYGRDSRKKLRLKETKYVEDRGSEYLLKDNFAVDALTVKALEKRHDSYLEIFSSGRYRDLENAFVMKGILHNNFVVPFLRFSQDVERPGLYLSLGPESSLQSLLTDVIHLPGLRGNPERHYLQTATGPKFPGRFERYFASIIHSWQTNEDPRLSALHTWLKALGLTSAVKTTEVGDTHIELWVNRLPGKPGRAPQWVNIADVGFGVSQVMAVLVGLLVADKGRLVYIEQPELHLHPRAQVALAQILVEAANRGVKTVVETHSDLLLLAIQTHVAKGELAPEDSRLHWFSQKESTGRTEVSSTQLDKLGAFGDWPEDFGRVAADLETDYLDAVAAARNR